MGGAGGHMWHPFDCPDVNSGQDLIDFFKRSIDAIKRNPAALKIDGVNLSFRLKENPGTPTGYEFVVDRGSMKPLDVQGVTADNADQRFVLPDGSPHGMVEATSILLGIFNAAIGDILPELKVLGMLEDMGPFARFFNTEFVLKKINVKEYPFNFIALHGVSQFVKKGPKSRKGTPVDFNQDALERVKEKVQPYANQADFKVFTSIPTTFNNTVLLEDALNKQFTIVYKSFAQDPEEPGELGAGEGSTKPIKVWLADVNSNPVNQKVIISDQMRQIYPSMGKSQTPYAKNIYLEVLKGTAISDIAGGPEDIEPIVDAVVVMHATRLLGNAVLDALESEEFGSAREQEGVVIKDSEICGGTSFKFTGDFIVGGLASTFEEAKYRKGELIKEFIVREQEEEEQEEQNKDKFIVLIPGGFKPPTAGHYHMIKNYDERSNVHKVLVITGPKPREGVTLQQSKDIFKIYGGFSNKVDFVISDDPTPMRTAYELLQNENFVNQFPNMKFALGAGDKGDDPKRIDGFVNYFMKNDNLKDKVSWFQPAKALEVGGKPASASRMRKAYREKNWEEFKNLLPDDNHYDDVVQVLNMQDTRDVARDSMVAENFLLAVPQQSFLVEKKMTKGDKIRDTRLRKKMDKAGVKADFIKRYGKEKGKDIYFATIRKRAMAEQTEPVSADASKEEIMNTIKVKIREMLPNIMPDLLQLVPQMNQISNLDIEVINPAADALARQLSKAVEEKTVSPKELAKSNIKTEASGMAGGGIAIAPAKQEDTLIGEEDNE